MSENVKKIAKEEKERKFTIQKNIEHKVRLLEKYNYFHKEFNQDKMVKKIRAIVEDEVK